MAIHDKAGSARPGLIPVLAVALLLMLPSPLRARAPAEPARQEKAAENKQTPGSTVVSGAALKIGAALEDAAPPSFVKWARNYSKREILKSTPAEGAVAAALLSNYPKASAEAREAGEFLTWYVAYLEGTKSQETAAQRVRDVDRDIGFLNDNLRNIRTMPIEMERRAAAHEFEDRLMTRLQYAERTRDMYKRVRDEVAARVDVCIERLAALSESRKDRDPGEIKNLK